MAKSRQEVQDCCSYLCLPEFKEALASPLRPLGNQSRRILLEGNPFLGFPSDAHFARCHPSKEQFMGGCSLERWQGGRVFPPPVGGGTSKRVLLQECPGPPADPSVWCRGIQYLEMNKTVREGRRGCTTTGPVGYLYRQILGSLCCLTKRMAYGIG